MAKKAFNPYYPKTSKTKQIWCPMVLNLHLVLLRKAQSFKEKKMKKCSFLRGSTFVVSGMNRH